MPIVEIKKNNHVDFKNTLPGVPHVESPFFNQFFSPDNCETELLRISRELNENGFVVIDFPDKDFDRKAELIKNSLRGKYDWDKWHSTGYEIGNGMRIQDAWEFDENVRSIAINQVVIDLISRLYGRKAQPFQSLNFPVGTQQHFHSDAIHFSSIPERFMCGVWVALEDISEDAGPLEYYPGSHKWPIYTNEHIGLNASLLENKPTQELYEPMWRSLIEAHGLKKQTFTAKKGQALIWAANLLHGGGKQKSSSKTRWSQVTHYYFENCAYYSPLRSDPFFGSIDFKNVTDMVTRRKVANQYLGNHIPQDFVKLTDPKLKRNAIPGEFDPYLYLLKNPDVKAAGLDAWEHYSQFGWREGRPIR
ncbi:phytanoyl-CoA dioxygenase [Burkholderia lata]|uniref:Phytanoyl-CoA dioxygenase n=2 Tax=Burkholderia lata (strain ATCC 17760 / DSM 23089 / LMG 22485 / NCIMB 9086 / R18194 / 383) TaxID=482957 RepID=A0A6P3BCJ3_BURL3|nr:phytanoyl-CoA dioxygenase family protein [Burkholderia lata]VWD52989.1 phytanoyl-CoA dioxygenase [Burkholderia lata]